MSSVLEVISNSSPLIALDNIGMLGLMERCYGRIVVAEEVRAEFGETLPTWLDILSK
jgi:predicted nucleic acid-binding protein